MRLNKIQKTAVTALEDIKARDITVLDVRKLTSLYDTMIIATAESNRQVKALANHVRERLKGIGAAIMGVEGEETGEWVLVDCGDAIVHILQPALRQYYNLEEIWGDKPVRIKLSTPNPFGGARPNCLAKVAQPCAAFQATKGMKITSATARPA